MSSSPSGTEPLQVNPMGKKKKKKNPLVVVVGAGFAGIAAAAALREGGVEDVLVLEAQNRPGGRVQKLQLDDGFFEPGAQFIHGERGNALYELAEKYGLLLDKGLYQNGETSDSSAEDYRNHHFVTSEGRLLGSERVAPLLRVVNQIFRNYANSFFVERHTNDPRLSTDHDSPAGDAVNHSSMWSNLETSQESNDTPGNSNRLPYSGNSPYKKGCRSGDGECQELTHFAWSGPDDCIIKYGGTELEEDGKGEHTFTEVLRKSRERILEVGDESEKIKLAVLKWMEQWEYTDNAARLPDLSLQAYGKYGYIPGYGLTVSCSGLEDVFRVFLDHSLPGDSLRLNTPVQTILWADQSSEPGAADQDPDEHWDRHSCPKSEDCDTLPGGNDPDERLAHGLAQHSDRQNDSPRTQRDHPVQILCEDGEEYRAEHVIVTSSIGYLQKNQATLFKPALPEKIREAVHQMGFGVVAKVFLVWDDLDQVLDSHVEGVQMLWVDGQPVQPPSDRTTRRTKNGLNWYDFLQGFERVESHKGALMTWLAGEEAEIMGALSEQEVKDVLFELMVQFLGNPLLPPPKQVVRSLWHSNPYILGSYSYIPVHMDPHSHDLLSVPLPSFQNPVLQLCGEATSRRFYSSVHGAIDSGRRAARVILRHHRLRHQMTSQP